MLCYAVHASATRQHHECHVDGTQDTMSCVSYVLISVQKTDHTASVCFSCLLCFGPRRLPTRVISAAARRISKMLPEREVAPLLVAFMPLLKRADVDVLVAEVCRCNKHTHSWSGLQNWCSCINLTWSTDSYEA